MTVFMTTQDDLLYTCNSWNAFFESLIKLIALWLTFFNLFFLNIQKLILSKYDGLGTQSCNKFALSYYIAEHKFELLRFEDLNSFNFNFQNTPT